MAAEKPRRLLWALSPMFRINWLTGIAPTPFEENVKPNKWTTSFNYLVYAAILLLSTYLAWRIPIEKLNSDDAVDESEWIKNLWCLLDIITCVSCGCIYLLKHSSVRRLFIAISEIQRGLAKDFSFDIQRIRRFVEIQLLLWIIMGVNLGVLSWRSIKVNGIFTMAAYTEVIIEYFTFVQLQLAWQFFMAVFLLRKCISGFNLEIRSWLPACQVKETRSISRLKQQFLEAYKTSKWIEGIYGICNVIFCLHDLLRMSFLLYSSWDGRIYTPSGEKDVIAELSTSFWILSSHCVLVVALYFGENLYAESDKTGKLVSEMILKVKDHRIRRELHLFSLQLLHTKFHFTACGFFPLDFTLLTSMAAAVVTYLVILVQFQESEKAVTKLSCNCSHNILTENGTM
ncbi:Gustatory receptor 14c [Ladona fulva]|uniref:Gustatory receptor n=1 Tax=Ladona fulva TaxID=123851 RepID=A0A8K0KAZ7_LADFU|nr:Gustatory receptor 14c [Ladona fulva]